MNLPEKESTQTWHLTPQSVIWGAKVFYYYCWVHSSIYGSYRFNKCSHDSLPANPSDRVEDPIFISLATFLAWLPESYANVQQPDSFLVWPQDYIPCKASLSPHTFGDGTVTNVAGLWDWLVVLSETQPRPNYLFKAVSPTPPPPPTLDQQFIVAWNFSVNVTQSGPQPKLFAWAAFSHRHCSSVSWLTSRLTGRHHHHHLLGAEWELPMRWEGRALKVLGVS